MRKLSSKHIHAFQKTIWQYYHAHGRDLPWRPPSPLLRQGYAGRAKLRKDKVAPYKVLVSEFMLQQTQVERVIPKYKVFLKKFPGFRALARAPLAEVLKAWQGLGYNRRALMLKKTAVRVMEDYNGKLPADPKLLDDLPGIGPGTAGAIAAFAFQIPVPFIETNIRRVYLHYFFPKKKSVPDADVLGLAGQTLDAKNPREWYYALMDYGAMLGREEKENPNRRSRHYAKQSRFEGSDRQIRGRILRLLVGKKSFTRRLLSKDLKIAENRLEMILAGLEKEGFIRHVRTKIIIPSDKSLTAVSL